MNYFSWANWWNSLIFSMLIWPIWSLDSKIELTNGINLFFACWYNFMQTKLKVLGVDQKWMWPVMWRDSKIKSWSKICWVGMVKNGCDRSGHGTLKLAVSSMLVQIQEISWFNDFWAGLVKDGSGLLVHEILKCALS